MLGAYDFEFSARLRTNSCVLDQPLLMPLCSSETRPKPVCVNLISVSPPSSLSRYWILLATGCDMKSGPLNSSKVGRLIACTMPQQWPLPSPRSRNQRPPGHASILKGIGVPSGFSLAGPICSSSAAKVTSMGALTRISWVILSVRDSISVGVEVVIDSPWKSLSGSLARLRGHCYFDGTFVF